MADFETEGDSIDTAEEYTPGGDAKNDDFALWESELTGETDDADLDDEDPDELERKRDNSERAKTSMPETIIFTLIALFTDTIEYLAGLANVLPVLGQAIWFMVWVFGLFVSAIIILWSFIRGVHGSRAIKFGVYRIIGFMFDAALAGFLPIRTIVLVVTIWLNNRLENKEIDRLVGLLSKVKI